MIRTHPDSGTSPTLLVPRREHIVVQSSKILLCCDGVRVIPLESFVELDVRHGRGEATIDKSRADVGNELDVDDGDAALVEFPQVLDHLPGISCGEQAVGQNFLDVGVEGLPLSFRKFIGVATPVY